MAATVTYSSLKTGADAFEGHLFDGIKFWLSAKVPQRSRFISDIKANGGQISQLEKTADVMIVDHAKKEALPGTYSYTFIEKSIRNGALENLANHVVGPAQGAIRHVGSVTHPAKLSRQRYTQEDERILWDWVNANPQKGGGTDGNEIYKQLELKHPQHPWQSWRDHYIKSMKGRAQPIYPPNNGPPTPPSELPATESGSESRVPADVKEEKGQFDEFTQEDEEALMDEGQHILSASRDEVAQTWRIWSKEGTNKKHSPKEWQAFWEQKVLPKFLEREAMKTKRASNPKKAITVNIVPDVQLEALPASSTKVRNVGSLLNNEDTIRTTPPKVGATRSSQLPTIMQTDGAASAHDPIEEFPSPLGTSILKRKRTMVDEVPSSPPPPITLTPISRKSAKKAKEIASTPEQSPQRQVKESQRFLSLGETFKFGSDEVFENPQEGDGSSPLGQQPSESLSEPDHSARASTQALLRETTPYIDLEIALPEGGWGGDEDVDHADKSASESEHDSAQKQAPAQDTQAIFHSTTTQIPDLSVPEPDDLWESLNPPSSPPLIMPSSPAAASESSSAQQAHLDEEIDALIADHLNQRYSAIQVITVLNSTCTNIPLTKQVLKQMGPQGKSIKLPQNIRGVWTADDDRDLQSSDARKVGRLEPKHGADNVNARYEWLELMAPEE